LQFGGSVLLVTHDRYFLDKVATAILAFDGEGHAVRYPGNYETYTALRPAPGRAPAPLKSPPAEKGAKPRKPGKLSFKEQRELESMESLIEAAEAAKEAAEKSLSDPQTYARESHRVAELQRELERSGAEADRLYARWQELQDLQSD
jgi:ATP-binding cassette subfamily F protein uup